VRLANLVLALVGREFVVAAGVLLLTLAGCEGDPRCSKQPEEPGQFGECAAIIGYYYSQGSCHRISGCDCDSVCRRDHVPFCTEEECVETCE